jgi:hypothetical protein
VIGFFLIIEMAHASDMWRMAVLFRPVDGFSLRFERAEYMVGVVFDHIIINVATLGAALGSRLNINVRHARLYAMDALKSSQQPHRVFGFERAEYMVGVVFASMWLPSARPLGRGST